MGTDKDSNEMAEERTEFAEDRTDWAEDRTLMANERTFAGWMRTGLAAVGIGLGFNALFGKLEPQWLARALATAFILIGIFIFYMAQRNGCKLHDRLNKHEAKPMDGMNMRIIAAFFAVGSFSLALGVWFIDVPEG